MKKPHIGYLVLFLGICALTQLFADNSLATEEIVEEQTFKDEPALTRTERGLSGLSKAIGTGVGGYGGGIAGGYSGATIGASSLFPQPPHLKKGSMTISGTPPSQHPRMDKVRGARETVGGALVGGVSGLGIGGYAGYKISDYLMLSALAKLHGVSNRVELISQYYNINLEQYGALLKAAEQYNVDKLLRVMNKTFSKRFGNNWKELLVALFKKYDKRGDALVKEGSFSKHGKARKFVRMVELGAALANALDVSDPDPKTTMQSALRLYQQLGLLP